MTIRELIEHCRGRNLYIQTHNFPDPDAIASGFGLKKLFERFGVSSTLCYVGKLDRISTKKMTELLGIEMFSQRDIEEDMATDDPIICVDSQKGSGNILDLKGDEIACIDHHQFMEVEGLIYHDVRKVGACATMICGYYQELGQEPDEMTATALLYGLKNDTMNFTRGVTDDDIRAFLYLHGKCDRAILSKLEHDNMEYSDLKAYGTAIENIVIYDNLGMAMIPFSCPDALIAVVADFILSLEAVEVSVVYSKRKDGIKFSARSEIPQRVNAADLLAEALKDYGDGGGHPFMAGGLIPAERAEALGEDADHIIHELILSHVRWAGSKEGSKTDNGK